MRSSQFLQSSIKLIQCLTSGLELNLYLSYPWKLCGPEVPAELHEAVLDAAPPPRPAPLLLLAARPRQGQPPARSRQIQLDNVFIV